MVTEDFRLLCNFDQIMERELYCYRRYVYNARTVYEYATVLRVAQYSIRHEINTLPPHRLY